MALAKIKAYRRADALIVQRRKLETRVEVKGPICPQSTDGIINAVVTIKTSLPREFASFLKPPGFVDIFNSMASLGAVVEEDGQFFVGSRLTIYEGDDAWRLYLPLVLDGITDGVDAILGAARRILINEPPKVGESEWTEADFEFVQAHLSPICFCNAGANGLTAEFKLKSDAISACLGHHETALWQILGTEPHPVLGGGLLCLLQMPHQIRDKKRLRRVIDELNRMEMVPDDLPPHFGAWCQGTLRNNPAYVTFLPNVLHDVASGLALNLSVWALHRAQWADAMMIVLGAR